MEAIGIPLKSRLIYSGINTGSRQVQIPGSATIRPDASRSIALSLNGAKLIPKGRRTNEMNQKEHWKKAYAGKPRETLGWYRPHLKTSLQWI